MLTIAHHILVITLSCILCSAGCHAASNPRDTISLAGKWSYWLHGAPASVAGEGTLSLPGTLDTNGVGIPVPVSDNTANLSRRVSFSGDATYSKEVEIPDAWAGKSIHLHIERSRPSSVCVDGEYISSSSLLSSPQRFDLSRALTPGRHIIEVTVNNADSIPASVRNNSHACTESTQTNWNGMIGEIFLEARPNLHISSARPLPDTAKGGYEIKVTLSDSPASEATVTAGIDGLEKCSATVSPGESSASLFLPLPPGHQRWSEWTPSLDDISITLSDMATGITDSLTVSSGFRDFSSKDGRFSINGDPVFLRGRHDACVFPITAHVPMDIDSWRDYFRTIKNYGLNHVRFHSWCPPEAAFRAADEAGVYLQPELPIWGEIDNSLSRLTSFLHKDMEGIMEQYAAHPSFVMFAIGNELWGDKELMTDFIDDAREMNPGLLATQGSNVYLGWNGHLPGEDFLVTCRVGGGDGFSTHARASFSFADADNGGIMNSTHPNSVMNFSHAISLSPVPVVGHETGQYQFYPDFSSIHKYDGCVLRPDNLVEFENRALKAGTLRKSHDFFRAAGAWASRLYRADMEMNLRTPGMGGFQLLDIQDYPGQGTALVGILDPFMDSKGIVTPEEWRRSCGEVTILAEMPRFCFSEGETVSIGIKVANFSNSNISDRGIKWSTPFANGVTAVPEGKGLLDIAAISLTMPKVKKPSEMQLTLKSTDGTVSNSYTIWVFPEKMKEVRGVEVTSSIDNALSLLNEGRRVILLPDSASVKDAVLGPLFQTDYWNYRMFRTICDNVHKKPSPGTMGLLINDKHPVFKNYPTSYHTDWQWFPVVSNSYPLIIDRLPADIDPVVEVIDNIERNYRLALMLECNVGKGKLLILTADMEKASEHPEGRWLLQAMKEYMASKDCKPKLTLSELQVRYLLTKPSTARYIKEIQNVSYQ